MNRRSMLGFSLAAVGGIFVPKYGQWYRQGSGLLVPRYNWVYAVTEYDPRTGLLSHWAHDGECDVAAKDLTQAQRDAIAMGSRPWVPELNYNWQFRRLSAPDDGGYCTVRG